LRALQNFTLPFCQFLSAMGLLLLPWASARFAEEGRFAFRRRVRQVTLLLAGMASAYFVVLWLFGGTIMRAVYAGRYVESARLLALVAAPVVLLAASQGSMIAIQAMQSPADILFGYTVAAAATVATGIPLTRYWGLPGAATGILVSYLTFFLFVVYRCQARLREPSAVGVVA